MRLKQEEKFKVLYPLLPISKNLIFDNKTTTYSAEKKQALTILDN